MRFFILDEAVSILIKMSHIVGSVIWLNRERELVDTFCFSFVSYGYGEVNH